LNSYFFLFENHRKFDFELFHKISKAIKYLED